MTEHFEKLKSHWSLINLQESETMKTAKVESKKIVKAAKPRRVAGVQVRSGVKAGDLAGWQSK